MTFSERLDEALNETTGLPPQLQGVEISDEGGRPVPYKVSQVSQAGGGEINKTPISIRIEILAHPEGSKRGGYVPTTVIGGKRWYWNETFWEWHPYQ